MGTAIATLVRSSEKPTDRKVHLRSLWGAGKLAQLNQEAKDNTTLNYSVITPRSTIGVSFADRSHAAAYGTWPSLPAIFPVTFAGVQTARDSTVIDIDPSRLEQRLLNYLDPKVSDDLIKSEMPAVMATTKRFDPLAVRRTLLEKGFKPWQIRRFAYRPFDIRWLYWEPTTKLLDEKREDFVGRVAFPCPVLITQQKTRMGVS